MNNLFNQYLKENHLLSATEHKAVSKAFEWLKGEISDQRKRHLVHTYGDSSKNKKECIFCR